MNKGWMCVAGFIIGAIAGYAWGSKIGKNDDAFKEALVEETEQKADALIKNYTKLVEEYTKTAEDIRRNIRTGETEQRATNTILNALTKMKDPSERKEYLDQLYKELERIGYPWKKI